ncbi:ACP phosphodiesterase [Zoogloeaceae bacterium G21618-S1]|nr:ACP phosphodiesterase [Zoogloeaceae bacterium G21618-S1]
MNFLAHLWLAGPNEGARLGAVAGDFVKGVLPGNLPADIATGVALHRAIDMYAEAHPTFQRSRERVTGPHRRFAGVMVDMFYDHFLAAQWAHWHPQEALADYAARQYALLAAHQHRLPPRAAPVLARMAEHDWLTSYREVDTIVYALDRIAHRLKRPEPFLGCGEALRADYAGFAADAQTFLSDARAFAQTFPAR